LGLRIAKVVENFARNNNKFTKDIDYRDLKSVVPQKDNENIIDITGFLKNIGYSQNRLNRTKQWLIFSYSGMMKLVKIATTKESWEIYDRFLEDYFKTKAKNQSMKKSIEDEIKELQNEKAQYLGQSLLNQDEQIRIKYAAKSEELTRRIIKLEKSQSEKEIIKKVQDKINIADKIGSSKDNIDIGNFAKAIGVKGIGRNKLFAWLREQEILRTNNVPYQRYMDYFSVQTVPGNNGHTYYKTLLKPTAIKYILKRLNKNDVVIEKSVDDILNELNEIA